MWLIQSVRALQHLLDICCSCCSFTWEIYAKKLMTLSRVYTFCKYVTHLDRQDTRRFVNANLRPMCMQLLPIC